MLKKLPMQPQFEMFKTVLPSIIHSEHELCLLSKKIDWEYLGKEFAPLYGNVGRQSVQIQTIVWKDIPHTDLRGGAVIDW